MKISVVVANWNYERFLEPCIESVLSQRGVDFELVLVDDGSTDNSAAVMAGYERVATVLHKENGGQASALNFAFPHCKGDLILFLDADDVLSPGALKRVQLAYEAGVSKIHFALEVIDEEGHPLGTRVPRAGLQSGDLRGDVLSRGIYISPPSSGNVYSREFLQAVMPIPEVGWPYADAYLICLAPLYGKVLAIDMPLGQYRRHTANLTDVSMGTRENVERKLETMLRTDMNIRGALEQRSRQLGLTLSPSAVVTHWLHLKAKLAMVKLQEPTFRSVSAVLAKFVQSVNRAPELTLPSRVLLTAWGTAVAMFPGGWAEVAIRYGFAAGNRKKRLTWWPKLLKS